MAKMISQETFDDVIMENVVEFSMSPDEARNETIKQFEAQGISLANIIQDLEIDEDTGKPVLNETIDKLKAHITQKSESRQKILHYLTIINDDCLKSLPHRILAGKNGAHDTLVTFLEEELNKSEKDLVLIERCLCALNSLTHKQPDLFDAEAMAVILKLLQIKDIDILFQILKWLQKATIMHEINRQNIMNSGVLKLLKPLVFESNTKVLREVLSVFRNLVLDDDIRVEFSTSHDHARQIANECLIDLMQLLNAHNDVDLLGDLLLTIATLTVRQELCKAIDDAGGLRIIFDLMIKYQSNASLNLKALKLVRALAGNDTVKVHIVQSGVAPIIKDLLQSHRENESLVSITLACISTLTLRVKENSAAFFETGIAEIICEVIQMHSKHKTIQRNGAWAIRNMVSRSRNQCESWLSYGIEDLLNSAMIEHPSVQQDIKSALRDLGCKVDLKEEWTGTAEKKILN